jgi:hypothetical protein
MCALAYWQLGFDTQRASELANRSLEANPNSAIAWTIRRRRPRWTKHVVGGRACEAHCEPVRLNPTSFFRSRSSFRSSSIAAAAFASLSLAA